ncbi:YafY family protein [Pseudomonas sp. 43mfcvi1.1]|uniref:helix-turn-helix transcriptional regulator n=1 Tax=Pseudomonas sp. 43mfcvi1.1 TaxID=1761894 RepID=UPI001C47426B|nr:YafY family protein [Pseudomonas sp. 43mfcvi1.1]
MSRSHRLFDLMQVLRRHRGTVSGVTLSRELNVSLRTIRRDVITLQSMGADIVGEPGVGYILRPGFLLPPLSFTEEEIQALMAGAQWVSRQTDEGLAHAVQNALAKIDSVLPPQMRRTLDHDTIYVSRNQGAPAALDLAQVRLALREQRKMQIVYKDETGEQTQRILWPIMLGFVESQRYIAGWCELRGDYRLFRTDRIVEVVVLEERYARPRQQLVKEWRSREAHPCKQKDCS